MKEYRYLFFDLEFASSKNYLYKICEFGYVIVDDDFNVIESNNFLINPNIGNNEWDWYVVKNMLQRPKNEYINSPTFDKYYYHIKNLIDSSKYVFGHTTISDVKGLNDGCKRYGLPSIDFNFYDVKTIYKIFNKDSEESSLEGIIKELNIESENKVHDAQIDALNTMLILREIKRILNLSMDELVTKYPESLDSNKNFEIKSQEKKRLIIEEKIKKIAEAGKDNTMFAGSIEYIIFKIYLDNVKISKRIKQTLKDKKVCISLNYEELHYKQMLNLVQIITDRGGKYHLKSSEADIFVTYDLKMEDGSTRSCSRLKYAQKAIESGVNITIVDFESFLKMLNITENELNNMSIPSFDFLYSEDAIIKDKTFKRYFRSDNYESTNSNSNTMLGDIYKDFFDNLK